MSDRFRLRLRDAVMLVAFPCLALALIVGAAGLDYLRAIQFDDWWSREARLRKFLAYRLDVVDLFRMMRVERRLDPEAPDPRRLRLRVEPGPWVEWQQEPLGAKDQWLEAAIQRGPALSKVEIKKRGDTSVHWTTPKKSFAIKTPRDSLYKGFRRLAYSAKDVLPQVVTARLAEDFGLLAPKATVAPVYLNDRFYGMYRVMEPIDESFLRRLHRMPGNIFRADTAERGEYFKGVPRGVFGNPAIWDRTAQSNKPGDRPGETLDAFLAALNRDDFEGHLALMGWLDRDEVARLLAVMVLVGDPYHMDDVHNQNWYFDPSAGRLHPIPWDLRLWRLDDNARKRPLPLNRFLEEATRNPWLVDTAIGELARRTAGGGLRETVERRVRELYAPYADEFRYDALRGGSIPEIGDPDEVLAVLDANLERIGAWLDDVRFAAHLASGPDVSVLDVESRGFRGADLRALTVGGVGVGTLRLRADRNRNGRLDDGDPAVPARTVASADGVRLELERPEPLPAALDSEALTLRPAPLHYRFFLEHPGAGPVRLVALELVGRHGGPPVTVDDWPAGSPISPTTSWHPWQYPVAPSDTVRLAGEVRLDRTLRIERGQTLRIEPGSRIRIEPGVSILAYGRVLAEGEASRPIRIEPADASRPWGALVLQGAGTDGSRFDHVTIRGGSGARLDRVIYSGMVSVQWADDVRFRNVTLAANVGCDDTINAVHSRIELLDCEVLEANSDAIDFDYSTGIIAGCRIERPANDAIDLMTSTPRIVGNSIFGAGDKGISIGEASRPLVFGNTITGGNRGLEIKDLSEPWIVHNTITGNGIGILQNVKNLRYGGGGLGKLVRSVVRDNDRDLVQDDVSRLTVLDSAIGEAPHDGGDAAWVYRMTGLWPAGDEPGVQPVARRTSPVRPVPEERYEDDFESVSDGWRAEGGITRLDKRDHALFVSFGRGHGRAVREVDWDLTDDPGASDLVLELRATNVTDAAIEAEDDAGRIVRVELTAGDDPAGPFELVSLTLPPARYRALRLLGAPDDWSAPSRILVRSLRRIPGGPPAPDR